MPQDSWFIQAALRFFCVVQTRSAIFAQELFLWRQPVQKKGGKNQIEQMFLKCLLFGKVCGKLKKSKQMFWR